MDSDTEQIKEVYAHYGLAMFTAQGIERTLSVVCNDREGRDSQNLAQKDLR
jgi:hypothetical protein